MDKHKMLSLVLMDLCAFAYTQAPENSRAEALVGCEDAFRMAESLALPELQIYRDFLDTTIEDKKRETAGL